MPIIGARVSEQLLDQYPRPIIDTKNTVDDIESAHESGGNDGLVMVVILSLHLIV